MEYEQIMQALRNAHAAGDTEGARRLAQMAREVQAREIGAENARQGLRDSTTPLDQPAGGISVDTQAASELVQNLGDLDGNIAAMAAGARDFTGFGFMDNINAAIDGGLLGAVPVGSNGMDLFNYDVPIGERYAGMRDQTRAEMDAFQEESPVAFGMGNIIGGVATSAPFAPRIPPTAGMLDVMKALGIYGAAEGALFEAGTGDGESMGEIATDAAKGAGWGALLGAGAVPVVAGATRMLADPIGGIAGAIRNVPNPARAGRVVSRAFQRSGQTVDDVMRRITDAAADGQDMFRTADALGLPGQRQIAGIARSPGDASTQISQWLDQRQLGQNERVSSFLADAVDTPQTANARQLALEAQRRADGAANYGDARMQADPVDVSGALNLIDERLGQINVPGVGQAVSPSPLDRTFEQIRARLAVPAQNLPEGTNMSLSDFSRVFEVKRELDGAIGAATRAGDGFQVQMLTTLRNTLDDALAQSSTPYAGARDTYRQQSRVIDAIDQGTQAASPRVRTQDALDQFYGLAPQQTPNPANLPAGGMSTPNPDNLPVPWVENALTSTRAADALPPPNPQDGFRVGYVDPLLARIENQPPTVNSARPLTTPKTQEMLAAISSDPALIERRLQREMDMFQTRQMATGGSPTANLLQDIADVSDTAPNVAEMVLNPRQSIIKALGTHAGNFVTGQNEQTRRLIAEVLMSEDPQAALAPLLQAAMTAQGFYTRPAEAALRQIGYQAAMPNQ